MVTRVRIDNILPEIREASKTRVGGRVRMGSQGS